MDNKALFRESKLKDLRFQPKGVLLAPSPLSGRTKEGLGVRNFNLSTLTLWGNLLSKRRTKV